MTVDCRAKRLVGQLPPHSPDYMPTMSRLVLSRVWKGKRYANNKVLNL